MNPLPQHANNTLDVAKQTLSLSEKSGDRTLKIFGYGMLLMTGLATTAHAFHAIYRDLFGAQAKAGRSRGNHTRLRYTPGGEPVAEREAQPPAREVDGDHSWVRRTRLAEREDAHEPDQPRRNGGHGRAGRG
jgi:hypothetical protein